VQLLPTVISLIGLFVAIATFFLVQLRPARITVYLGPVGIVGYPLTQGGFIITIPATFTNHGARTGVVLRSAVTLHLKDMPQERYFMQWNSFAKTDFTTNQMKADENTHSLAVPGKSIVAKTIRFYWLPTSIPQIRLRNAAYRLSCYFWASDTKFPYCKIHDILITNAMVDALEAPADSMHTQAVNIDLDKKFEINAVMNETEARQRLGGE
jgi:hypothetical protein